ncbi:conserved hypothetical protein [Theileria orientalis strain Shintoku]|uniref:Phorbol-ester/DAG-type domain-containing protein n=1 Tax=Theileria orientalis strain Shintoku TaxID=869250 RepID=J4C903_THEOR|nr:conserved hypothetical protein [Theileria orientalis strain Shintoku]BAM41688.1 conserved hypothetical protein [Theileria orientalis strain Shintoku]|eukprot:XP_009691989.1 conserved hypothetical protein [Theileria orientalis strain Shintoku]
MSSNVAVSLFLQRLLHEKYMEDSSVDSLIQGIIRGTGTPFSSKASFIQHANKLLSDVGFILVRVIVSGKKYYSLKDLDSTNSSADALNKLTNRDLNISQDLTEDQFKTPKRSYLSQIDSSQDVSENLTSSAFPYRSFLRQNSSKFTHSELMIFIDSINAIIQTGKPLPLRKQASYDSWTSLCSKRSLMEEQSQLNLLERFEKRKWLEFYGNDNDIAPGIRFYFDLSNFFDLRDLRNCDSCNSLIIFNEFHCKECKKPFHQECATSNGSGNISEQMKCFTCSIT